MSIEGSGFASCGWVRVTRYYVEHTCGQFKMGRDHSLAIAEGIAAKSDGLLDNSENITPKRIMLFVNE